METPPVKTYLTGVRGASARRRTDVLKFGAFLAHRQSHQYASATNIFLQLGAADRSDGSQRLVRDPEARPDASVAFLCRPHPRTNRWVRFGSFRDGHPAQNLSAEAWETIIIGGELAGLTAGIYLGRPLLRVLLIDSGHRKAGGSRLFRIILDLQRGSMPSGCSGWVAARRNPTAR
jgi:hypothetical protein